MKKNQSVRLLSEELERADRLVGAVARQPYVTGEVTRAYVLRLAVARGLSALEAELAFEHLDGEKVEKGENGPPPLPPPLP